MQSSSQRKSDPEIQYVSQGGTLRRSLAPAVISLYVSGKWTAHPNVSIHSATVAECFLCQALTWTLREDTAKHLTRNQQTLTLKDQITLGDMWSPS